MGGSQAEVLRIIKDEPGRLDAQESSGCSELFNDCP